MYHRIVIQSCLIKTQVHTKLLNKKVSGDVAETTSIEKKNRLNCKEGRHSMQKTAKQQLK